MTLLASLWTTLVSNNLSNLTFKPSYYLLFGLPTQMVAITDKINWEAVYLVVTLIIGALIAYEAIALKKNHGKLPTTLAFNLSSITETLWMFITSAVLYFTHLSTYPKAVAVAYILYGIFGWLYSFYLLRDQDLEIDEIDNVAMPAKFMDYSLSFAWVIMLSCLGFLFILFSQGKFHFHF